MGLLYIRIDGGKLNTKGLVSLFLQLPLSLMFNIHLHTSKASVIVERFKVQFCVQYTLATEHRRSPNFSPIWVRS